MTQPIPIPNVAAGSSSTLAISVSSSRKAMGERAASDVAREIRRCLAAQPGVRMIFAAAPSQSEILTALCAQPDIDWSRVIAFHMDEYLGLPQDAPQRFALWLREAIFDRLPFGAVHLIEPGNDPKRTTAEYSQRLNADPVDIVCCGIGVNGHLAFNDPPADFADPLTVKIVDLDMRCRVQQVEDRCFARLADVPSQAITVTVPGLLAARAIFCTVPGATKQEAVRRTLTEPISPMCPASALRRHPHCMLYLDHESAGQTALDGYKLIESAL